jgi:AraC family transcriptional regulator
MSDPSPNPYAARIQKVIAYLHSHLGEELSVARLGEIAGVSPFHFHRLFSAHTGVPLAKMIRELRLRQAAYQLAFEPEVRVIDVALGAGFISPETFARAFKAAFDQNPSEFRAEPHWEKASPFRLKTIQKGETMTPDIRITNDLPVAVLEHRGPPQALMASVGRFIAWRKQSPASPVSECRTFGVPFDDPDAVEPSAFRFDICGELKRPLETNAFGIVEKVLAGGRVAVVRHVGSHDTLGETVRNLYAEWLPTSGQELRDFPCYFEYVARMPKVAEHEQLTDVYLPLK